MAVDPDHRGRGIGKALIDARLRFAEQKGVENIYMPKLEDTNTLSSYYAEQGFRETPDGSVVRGENPMSMKQAVMHLMRRHSTHKIA